MSATLLAWSLVLAQLFLGLAVAFAAVRVVVGPRAQDRVLGVDTLYTNTMLLILTFGIRADDAVKAGERFIDACEFLSHLANIGDAKTLVIHPASTTHRQLDEQELARAGVRPDMIRLSVGIEDVDDILWDLDQALRKAV